MPSIRLNGISKRFGNIKALDGITFNVDGPGCIGILGPNGAGKTTMLKTLTNIIKPTSGTATVNGISVSEYPEKALATVGALVEQPEFYPYLTAREILSFVVAIKMVKNGKEEIRRVSELTSIEGYLDRKAGEFSRGMKQRLGIAVALVGDPDVLIFDEPTFGLDPSGMKRVRDIIKDINAKNDKIIILSTHLIYEAQEVCDRIIIVHNGKIGYDLSNGVSDKVKIELEPPGGSVDFPADMASQWKAEGNIIYVQKANGTRNSDLIDHCRKSGLAVKWVTPYNDIEGIYVSLTK